MTFDQRKICFIRGALGVCSESFFKYLPEDGKKLSSVLRAIYVTNKAILMQTRPGRIYDVAVYKKNLDGNLEKDVVSWDTSVNVYKYFNIASHR